MTIKRRFYLIFLGLLAVMILAGLVSILSARAALAVADVANRRELSIQLADEIKQSSDELTRMARSFVVTLEPKYEIYFHTILGIRNGEIPYPDRYNEIYFDFVISQDAEIETNGRMISMRERMEELEFPPSELAKIEASEMLSNALSLLETEAMNAAKGHFDDGGGNYELIGEPDQNLALDLLFGKQYHDNKAEIMRPIQEFFDLLELRTSTEIADIQRLQQSTTIEMIATVLLAILLTVFSFFSLNRKVILPIGSLRKAVQQYSATRSVGSFLYTNEQDEVSQTVRSFYELTVEIEAHEKQLRLARDEAQSGAEAKTNFLASMSHEIRTPMTAIIGMVEILQQEKLNSEQKDMLSTISHSGQALLSIINDILDFSKIEAGQMSLEHEPFSIKEVVEGACDTISLNAKTKGLHLLSYVDPEIPQFVLGDSVRLSQVIINLGGNAIKFTEHGTVQIIVELLAPVKNKACVKISVIDEGVGIARETQGKLFDAFTQAESSTTRKYGGTGLGLAICQRLAQLMGGEIKLESEEGKGSTFFVEIEFDSSDKTLAQHPGETLAGIKALILVKNPLEEFILKSYLEHWHSEVTMVETIDECLEIVNEFDVAVIGSEWAANEREVCVKRMTEVANANKSRLVILDPEQNFSTKILSDNIVSIQARPTSRSAFLWGVAAAVGRISPEIHYGEEVEEIEGHGDFLSIEEAEARGQLILVAEDNPTNRDVIGRQLNLLGYTFEMKDDGKEAYVAWKTGRYGLLLTDCHMPEWDGFQLTGAIRSNKSMASHEKHFPIIAATANAMQGEAERCFAAGMDAYLSKPINTQELSRVLKRWLPRARVKLKNSDIIGQNSNASQLQAVDDSVLKGMFGDSEQMFKEILTDFVAPSEQIVSEILAACKENSPEGIKQGAHKLKSAARSIGAMDLGELAARLEIAGKENDFIVIDKLLPELEPLFVAVKEYIDRL